MRRRRGITLLEVVLAIGLMVPMMATMFVFYSNALETADENAARIRRVQLARVILDRIRQELRQSTGFSAGYGTGIFGTRHQISINSVVIPDKALVARRSRRDRPRAGQFDLRQVDYYIAWDDVNTDENGDPRALGLVRRERRTFNKLKAAELPSADQGGADQGGAVGGTNGGAGQGGGGGSAVGGSDAPPGGGLGGDGGSGQAAAPGQENPFDKGLSDELKDEELEGSKRELYAPEIKFIKFLYHDGNRWWESWEIDQGNALPQMVMVTVGYEPVLPDTEEMEIVKGIFKGVGEKIEPLPEDRYSVIVRIPQADSFFGSRVQREASALTDLEDVQ